MKQLHFESDWFSSQLRIKVIDAIKKLADQSLRFDRMGLDGEKPADGEMEHGTSGGTGSGTVGTLNASVSSPDVCSP